MRQKSIRRPVELDPKIEAERVRLENEIFELKMRAPFPTAQAIARQQARLRDLEVQLKKLPPKLRPPPHGMRAGTVVVLDNRLGDGPTEANISARNGGDYDPFEREFGPTRSYR